MTTDDGDAYDSEKSARLALSDMLDGVFVTNRMHGFSILGAPPKSSHNTGPSVFVPGLFKSRNVTDYIGSEFRLSPAAFLLKRWLCQLDYPLRIKGILCYMFIVGNLMMLPTLISGHATENLVIVSFHSLDTLTIFTLFSSFILPSYGRHMHWRGAMDREWLPSFVKQRPPRTQYYEFLSGALPRAFWRCRIITLVACCAILAFLLFSTSLGAHIPPKYLTVYQTSSYKPCTFDQSTMDDIYLRPHTGQYIASHEGEGTWERVQEMVSGTRGFYVRDWPLQLGWNNMRYIIEAGLLHASLLNRTLIIPSFVYARSCLYDFDVCSVAAQKFHRGDEIGMGDFKYLSDAEQIAWRLPISVMLDLPRIRRAHSVITVSEYLRLQQLDPKLELGNGSWSPTLYHDGPLKPTLRSITNPGWDTGFVRVDRDYDLPEPKDAGGSVDQALRGHLNDYGVVNIDEAQNTIRDQAHVQWENTTEFEQLLHDAGWGRLYSFRGSFVEMFKAVTEYEDTVAPLQDMRGLVDGLSTEPADVVHVEGETHWNRKAGQLRFTTEEGRTHFAELVLHGIHPTPAVRALGECFAKRMVDLNGGRQYLAGHMRRGDFAVLNWAAEKTIQDHTARIKNRLENGLKSLREWAQSGLHPTPVPGIKLDTFDQNAGAPLEDDAFFLATDTSDPAELAYVHGQGAVLLTDLMQPGDEWPLGWPALFGDVRAQIEQQVAARAAFFYGHSMSSVAGGIANLRGARGKDPRTCYVD